MESTQVIIVGAGPAGLALALCLAQFKVKSVILEKEVEITEDPRGVYLTHDSVRILWDLGLGESMAIIGHEVQKVNFHTSSFARKPFHILELGHDGLYQTVPNGLMQIQPRLERVMREKLQESPFCDLRPGCEVIGRDQPNGTDLITVEYKDRHESRSFIQGSWLIGADGKKGVVRKRFLEASAGIKQVDSDYKYDDTWVAANLKIHLPTPETHPDFPLWDLGYSPESVYDLFWPKGWHFCSPPGKATAAGRFGPHEERLWRHEFAQNGWDDSMDAEALLWEHLTPMITRAHADDDDASGTTTTALFPRGPVTYPLDCIEVRRCRPFRFAHKVVNRWFDYRSRTVLIGDAAHVFPPFGGQGIASGLRDAHQLAWRLFLLLLQSPPPLLHNSTAGRDRDRVPLLLLDTWASERTQGVRDAASFTAMNERVCNKGDDLFFWIFRQVERLVNKIPLIPNFPNPMEVMERRAYKLVKDDGFFLSQFGGGGRLAQIYVEESLPRNGGACVLSDIMVVQSPSAMTLIVICEEEEESVGQEVVADVTSAVNSVGFDASVLSGASIKVFSPKRQQPVDDDIDCGAAVYHPASPESLLKSNLRTRPLYDASNFTRRLGTSTKFAIVRADLHIFALARNMDELAKALVILKSMLGSRG
ncbi:putative monooxygenase [Xylariomycetidae sp. FL2044]|nr:putative monooxygenase [Xylariomycetidae sp. FL2044]